MAEQRRLRPTEMLRDFALSLERLVTEQAASSAVQGAADGLRSELPEMDAQVRALVRDGVAIAGRLARDVARREAATPGATAYLVAAAAMRGALDELQRHVKTGLPDALGRRLESWLEHTSEESALRSKAIRKPGDRARISAKGAVDGAVEEFHRALPQVEADVHKLTPLAAELASEAGRGLLGGLESKATEGAERYVHLLERAGHALVHEVTVAVEDEMRVHRERSGGTVGAALEALSERSAAAAVRGATDELVRRLERARAPVAWEEALFRASRQVSRGVLSTLGASLRRPALVAAGACGALLVAALLLRSRR